MNWSKQTKLTSGLILNNIDKFYNFDLINYVFFFFSNRDVSVISANWLLETNSNYFKSKLKFTNDLTNGEMHQNIR